MDTARNAGEEPDLDPYYRGRIEPLSKRLLDVVEDMLGEESIRQQKEFEDLVERRLQNGAKFIPRKRQPR